MKKILSILCTVSAILLWGCDDDSSTSPNSQIDTFSSAEESSSSSFKDSALSSSRKELSTTSSSFVEFSSSSLVFSSSSETTSSSNQFHPCSEAPTFKENWKYLNPDIQYDCFKDSRDNQYYVTVKIGDFTWMAENLGYRPSEVHITKNTWYGYSAKETETQNQRGYLYTWDIAMADTNCRDSNLCKPLGQIRGICPEGFHLPSYWEWQDLFNAAGGVDIAARELKSTEVWDDTAKGTNKYGFSVIPNGPRFNFGYFNPVDFSTAFWTSDESGKGTVVTIDFEDNDRAYSMTHENKEYGFSIRCLMDYPEQEAPHSGTPHDPDKIYQCDEMLMNDINTWHFKDESQTEFQYFIDDSDSISVYINDSYSEYTSRTSGANNEEGLYIMFWAALHHCLPL